jgi:CubicO group peptidase (beta-lactamase class C family)
VDDLLTRLTVLDPTPLSRRSALSASFALPFAFSLAGCAVRGAGRRTRGAPRVGEYVARADALRARLPALAAYSGESIPGFQVACVIEGQVAWSEGYGTLARGSGRPVDEATVFDLGSLTKPMFAALVLRLRDRGVIDLDRSLLTYLDYADVRGEDAATRVTARHVLTHTTGLPNWRPFAPGSPLKFVAEPGARFGYSGEGFFWLQHVVESLTGRPAARLVQQEVLDPLGLARSSLVFEPRFTANYAQGHGATGSTGKDSFNKQSADRLRRAPGDASQDLRDLPLAAVRHALIAATPSLTAGPSPVLYPMNVAASLQSTASDYARFMTAFMASGGRPLLSAEATAAMLTSQARINPHTSYGLGWRVEETDAGTAFWHSGYNEGFHSFALGDPDGRFGVVVLTNSDEGHALRWPVVHGGTGHGSAAILS